MNKSQLSENDKYPVINGGVRPSGHYNEFNFEKDNITIAQGGSVGFVDWQNTNFWAGAHCYVIKTKNEDKLLNRYLYFVLKDKESYLMENKEGAGIPSLPRNIIKNLKVSIPSIEKQKVLVNILNTFEELTNTLKTGLPKEIELREQQYAYYRDKLLSFAQGTLEVSPERERERACAHRNS
ncbi:restriction endonuclease subunit S [Mycoplasmopsis columboralis]|uniref:restriction endonuclease subunit S n=1 Tax=Mycoplasmopsis columboralis TaxID=171282 RepID=UPI0021AC8B2E|nr:restriction endonuclease subunit S [Mycoplasmopsis columboralis]